MKEHNEFDPVADGGLAFETSRDGGVAIFKADVGYAIIGHAEAAIARLDEAERELAAIAGLEGGELRLASFPSASATVLTEAVSLFHHRHPAVRLSVADAEPEDALPRLRAAEIDHALTFDYPSVPKPEERDLEQTLVLSV
jgi:DNA-binding transcriptional LysR family regulator